MPRFNQILAREVLDSRGFPTIEVEVDLVSSTETARGRAIVPSGASTGEGEALELRDGDPARYLGKGVLKAVQNVRDRIAPALMGRDFSTQASLDSVLIDLDGTPHKSALGANAILGTSVAFCKAFAGLQKLPHHEYLSQIFETPGNLLPVPLMNILNGGKHADNGLAIQEFMIVPAGFHSFSEALRAGAEIFHRLKEILHQKGLATGVGDEGGFAPHFPGKNPHEQALQCVMQAISKAGYKAGEQIFLALDVAASEFVIQTKQQADQEKSALPKYRFEQSQFTSDDLISLYTKWKNEFPILSIEDGLSEHDWEGWKNLTRSLGQTCQLVGDDLFVTNPITLKKGIENDTANAILIKLNQIGTVTETFETMKLANQAGYRCITSHRSGETEDTFIADLAVGTNCGQIKTGSASRTDRIAKYNQLLRLEESLGNRGQFVGKGIYR